MYRKPSRRKKRNTLSKPNLIPILDAVFIFICFLLMSASFIKIFEIGSDIPMVSDQAPKSKKIPLGLTIKIYSDHISVYTGVPSKLRKRIESKDGNYDVEELHHYLINIKKMHKKEKTVIFEPLIDIAYEKLVKIMDSVRLLRKTDIALYIKDKSGMDIRLNELFSNIVFGNIQS